MFLCRIKILKLSEHIVPSKNYLQFLIIQYSSPEKKNDTVIDVLLQAMFKMSSHILFSILKISLYHTFLTSEYCYILMYCYSSKNI